MVNFNHDAAIERCRTAVQVPAISKRGDAKHSPMRKEPVKMLTAIMLYGNQTSNAVSPIASLYQAQ